MLDPVVFDWQGERTGITRILLAVHLIWQKYIINVTAADEDQKLKLM